MPRDLPGLYWDEERKRYFPLSARPAVPTQTGTGPNNPSRPRGARQSAAPNTCQVQSRQVQGANAAPRPRKRRKVELLPGGSAGRGLVNEGLRLSTTYSQMRRHTDKVVAHSLASLSEGKPFWHGDFMFSSMNVAVEPDGSFVASTGDKSGWLQTYTTDKRGFPYGGSRELFLGSEVTAVCRSETHRLAVSFGPSSKIAVENIAEDAEIWNILSIGDHRCHDVQTAHLFGKSLVLGSAKRGILLSDIQAGWSFDVLPTGSDVLSVCQSEHVVYTGTRNGSIQCFDKRLASGQKGQELFNGRFKNDNRSVTHLNILHETQMLVSTIRGDLELLDLRFARNSAPLVEFHGHVNMYNARLGIATSPCASYVFAAGQDNRVRGWSLRTGDMLAPLPHASQLEADPDISQLFGHTFDDPVAAIHVTEGDGGGGASANGLSLWTASGKQIYRYWLGQRLGENVKGY